MEQTKAEITLVRAQAARAKLGAFRKFVQEFLDDDGIICEEEAPQLWAAIGALWVDMDESVTHAANSYHAKRIADAVERGEGFDFSAYHQRILEPGNLQPINDQMNVVEMYPKRDNAA